MDGWQSAIPTDGCRRRAMLTSVGEARRAMCDVAASVLVDGARLSGADKGARAGQLVTSGASRVRLGDPRPGVGPLGARRPTGHPPVPASASLGQRLSMARAPPAGGRGSCPGSRQLVTLLPALRLERPPPRQLGRANWPPRACLRASPPPPPPPSSPPPPPPRPPRPPALPRPPFVPPLAGCATHSARLEGARPTGPPAPSTDSPSTGTLYARRRRPFSLHIPTDLARPIIVRANVPGSERRSGEAHLRRQTARRPCGHVPQPTGHCPSSPGGGARGSPRPSRPAN
ncbi:hypothetical protein V6Z77_010225 [Aspergillus fumigatus]